MSFVYAGQLALPTSVFNHETCCGDLHVAYGKLTYSKFKDKSLIQDLIDRLQPVDVFWVECDPSVPIHPHTDLRITAALNLYVWGGDAVTSFWEPKSGEQANSWPQDKSPNPVKNLWYPEQLNLTGSFCAQPGDAYWLDVTKVHSVAGIQGSAPRQFIQLCWSRQPFAELARLL
jgi:hypothetical protein